MFITRQMLPFTLLLYILPNGCMADTDHHPVGMVHANTRSNGSEDYWVIPPAGSVVSLSFDGDVGVLPPNDRQLFAYSLTKVEAEQCRHDLNATLWGILNGQRWAIAMYDASAKSATGIESGVLHQFGHFDECMDQQNFFRSTNEGEKPPNVRVVRSKYCLADVQMDGFTMHTVTSRQKQALNRTDGAVVVARWGACVPAACESRDVALFLQTFLQRAVISADRMHCQLSSVEVGKALRVDEGMLAYAVVLCVFLLLTALSTAYHGYLIYTSVDADDVSKRALPHETLAIALLSFSIIENTKKLFQTSTDQLGLNSIHGIKALSMLIILSGHALSFIYGGPAYNEAFLGEQTKKPIFAIFYNSLLFVDTFLLLSGFLFCLILLIELDRRRGHINPLILYAGRYIRLTPAYMVVIGFYMTWFSSIGSGPLWEERVGREQERCRASWWLNMLYVNNYFNTDNFCMFQSWYLAVDTQLFFIAPIFIHLLYEARKYGQSLLIAAAVCSSVVPFVVTYVWRLDPTLMVYGDELVDLASNNYYIGYYIKTHMRAAAYFIGLLTGFLVHVMREKGTRLPAYIVRFNWLISTAIGTLAMFSICHFYARPYTNIESVLYAGFHKLGWNLSVAWLVTAVTTGHAGWLQNFLSCRAFAPISRLSYCAYLSNGIVELYHSSILRNASHLSYINLINDISSHILDTFLLAFVVCLVFESPIHALERILLRKAGRLEKRTQAADNQTPSTSEEQVA